MKPYKYIALMLPMLAACQSEDIDADMPEACPSKGEIVCFTEGDAAATSRTYFELAGHNMMYAAKWAADDRLALCFDGSAQASEFAIAEGERTPKAVFHGPVPDSYSRITAVYPYSIFRGREGAAVDICLPETIDYDLSKILAGAMPMYARGTAAGLHFYNLMAVIRLSLSGTGLLRSITVSAPDGLSLSGNARITADGDGLPALSMQTTGKSITINLGAIFLSKTAKDIFIPIPTANYANGLKLQFDFAGKTETSTLGGPLLFERSVLRPVSPYEMAIPFEFDVDATADNEIWYRSESQQSLPDCDFGTPVVSHSYSPDAQIGVITTRSAITKIGGPMFGRPEKVTFVKVPDTVERIEMDGLQRVMMEEFDMPSHLKFIGADAFDHCEKLKRAVIPDGCETLSLGAFGDCYALEYVYLPKSLTTIGAYSFIHSTAHLDQWHGDCPLIDADRHALYSNSSYGSISETLTWIDAIAGCNLTEYRIPDQARDLQNYALQGCVSLKKLIIHENLQFMGAGDPNFENPVETIISYAVTPPQFDESDMNKYPHLKEIRVPADAVEAYKKASGWRLYASKISAL